MRDLDARRAESEPFNARFIVIPDSGCTPLLTEYETNLKGLSNYVCSWFCIYQIVSHTCKIFLTQSSDKLMFKIKFLSNRTYIASH